ncbi:hypothetical protein KP509_04G011900 [Ceratopteris richardii]|uniref:Uncharacterized protein n=1 Tax=Ceratopteris richardii TaxID=49495 RepID=A0A8T2UWS7_CERRI|nr:hypothetical protein KP509_04G011900 [Ceratopteris richardii]
MIISIVSPQGFEPETSRQGRAGLSMNPKAFVICNSRASYLLSIYALKEDFAQSRKEAAWTSAVSTQGNRTNVPCLGDCLPMHKAMQPITTVHSLIPFDFHVEEDNIIKEIEKHRRDLIPRLSQKMALSCQ